MRNIVLFIFFLLFIGNCTANDKQDESLAFLSLGTYVTYPYYITDYQEKFNFGYGLSISENFIRFKISSGIYISSKKYFDEFDNSSNIDKISYSLTYINIPLLISVPVLNSEQKKHQLLICSGIILNIPRNYHSVTTYKTSIPSTTNDQPISYKRGSSLHIGLQYCYSFNHFIKLNTSLFSNYKFKMDYLEFRNTSPQFHPKYSEDKLLFGIAFGVEFDLKKK